MKTSGSIPRIAIEFLLTGVMGRRRLQGVFEFLRQKQLKWDIRLPQSGEDLLRELKCHPDGIIVSRLLSPSVLRQVERHPAPVVFVDIPAPDRRHFRACDITIHNDDGRIGLQAAKYLAGVGRFNSFGVYSPPDPRYFSFRRREAFVAAVRRQGHAVYAFNPTDGGLGGWLKSLPKPAAVFATNDEGAREVLLACRQARLRVPEQLVILGADDDEIVCTLMSPELSSIRLDSEREGFQAAEELNRQLNRKARPGRKFILIQPLGVTERASTKPPPPATVLVNRALEYIRAQATSGATPDDVAHHLGCSRRLLDLRFRQLHSRSVLKELTAVRLAAVCAELHHTRDSFRAIARRCGFSSVGVLANLFRRTYAQSLRSFRQHRVPVLAQAHSSCFGA